MAQINIPGADFGEVKNVSDLLTQITEWRKKNNISERGYHSNAWFRGHSKRSYKLEPGVYREKFTKQSANIYGDDTEAKRLNLEREMLMEFRTAGARMIDSNDITEIYVLAQHYGMPTRLLDWTANPLAALFFAVCDEDSKEDGDVFVMEPTKMFPWPKAGSEEPMPHMRTIRHPQIRDAIGLSFWTSPLEKIKDGRPVVEAFPRILPFRPDNHVGRIGQQNSCFTMHTHNAANHDNPSLARLKIPGDAKGPIRDQLRQLNVNEFTVYNDLDHLSHEIKRGWKL